MNENINEKFVLKIENPTRIEGNIYTKNLAVSFV